MSGRSDNPFELKDPEIQWCLDLFRAHITDWDARKAAIERYMHQVFAPKPQYDPGLPLASVSYKQDRIAWYLWLADVTLP